MRLSATLVRLAVAVVGASQIACGDAPAEGAAVLEQGSTANHIDCDVSLGALSIGHLHGISILEPTRVPISDGERTRHLNELDALPVVMHDVFRARGLTISLTGGSVVNFAEFQDLRGVTPRGWEGTNLTWDKVPGTGVAKGVYLGDSAKPNNAYSLAMHEGTHTIDRALSFSTRSAALKGLYADELTRRANPSDANARYRRSNVEEYLAVAVDEYYCNATTRQNLRARYPDMHAYVATALDAEVSSLASHRR